MKKNILFIIFFLFFSCNLLSQSLTKEELEKREAEFNHIDKVASSFYKEDKLIKEDKKNRKRSRSFCTITDFKAGFMVTEKIENSLNFENKQYNWTLYSLAKYQEPIFLFFNVTPHFLKIEKKEVTQNHIREKHMEFGNRVRNILKKYNNPDEISKAINEILLDDVKKCHQTKDCKDCWMIAICNER